MPALITALWGGLLMMMASMVGRILITLGLSYVTYSGFEVLMDWLYADLQNNFNAMPAEVVQFLGYLWVDRAISMIFSAYAVGLGIKMAGGASITRMVQKAPGG